MRPTHQGGARSEGSAGARDVDGTRDVDGADRLGGALELSQAFGFLGPGPIGPHVLHAEACGRVVEAELRRGGRDALGAEVGQLPSRSLAFLDLGSGGGVPGLVLARRWPSSSAVLLDSSVRRTEFLRQQVSEMGWSERVEVITARAETEARVPARRRSFDVVVARAFGPPAVVAECAAGFLRVGGFLVVSEPPGPNERWPAEGLVPLAMGPARFVSGDFTFVVIEQVGACPDTFPRRTGVPSKRPLF